MVNVDLRIKLDQFEGPLDLLLHLIEKSEVDIYEVPIAQITNQYMAVLSSQSEWELEVASEFLVMAATLIAMKSRMLLPKPEKFELSELEEATETFDPRQQLVERLLEYKRYKRLGEMLREKEEERSRLYVRPPVDLTPYTRLQNPVEGLTADDLLKAFIQVLEEKNEEEQVATVVREEISVKDRMEEILQLLEKADFLRFEELFQQRPKTKDNIITTFLALLELMKLRQIACTQESVFSEIMIQKYEEVVAVYG